MKFAHLADIHIGSWKEEKLNNLSTDAFIIAIDICIKQNVDFVIIAGDLFNSPIPPIDKLKIVITKLKELKDAGIPVYGIPGSHDFSASGKTMIDVLESAGLFKNVFGTETTSSGKIKLKFVTDEKTQIKITGIVGKRGMLDKKYYENLDQEISNTPGKKIFVFHTIISELKPDFLGKAESMNVDLLPIGFDYYAGGHPHIRTCSTINKYQNVCYTGPLFPNSFTEIEKLGYGGFYIVDEFIPNFIEIKLHPVNCIKIDVTGKSNEKIKDEIIMACKEINVGNSIVTIRAYGTGRKCDVTFKDLFTELYKVGAYFIMKNTSGIQSRDTNDRTLNNNCNNNCPTDIENLFIDKFKDRMKVGDFDGTHIVKELLNALSVTKMDGEKSYDFEARLKKDVMTIFIASK